MAVPVMLSVNVEMFVLRRFMNMDMLVTFGHMEPNTGKHENARRAKSPIELPLPDGKCQRGPGKRSDGKIGAGPGGAKIPQCPDKENKAQAVAKKADGCCAKNDAGGGKLSTQCKRYAGIHHAGNKALPHRNLRGIAAGNLPCEIVVDTPAEAGGSNQDRSGRNSKFLVAGKRK